MTFFVNEWVYIHYENQCDSQAQCICIWEIFWFWICTKVWETSISINTNWKQFQKLYKKWIFMFQTNLNAYCAKSGAYKRIWMLIEIQIFLLFTTCAKLNDDCAVLIWTTTKPFWMIRVQNQMPINEFGCS